MNRRTALAASGVVALVAGCQTYGGEKPAVAPAAGKVLAQTGDIPVGGGVVFAPEGVVVTQPEAGLIKAFAAACTHQGCAVAEVKGGTINCTCHGSAFRVADGSVARGPAATPLPPAAVTVDGTTIRLG